MTLELNALADPLTFFLFTAVVVLLAFAALILFIESPMGRVLQAIRESEERARGCGYNTRAGPAGHVRARRRGGGPGRWAVRDAEQLRRPAAVLAAVRDRARHGDPRRARSSLFGPFLGAVAYLLLESTLAQYFRSWQLFVGAIFVVCVLLFPQGLWGLLTRPSLPRWRGGAGAR